MTSPKTLNTLVAAILATTAVSAKSASSKSFAAQSPSLRNPASELLSLRQEDPRKKDEKKKKKTARGGGNVGGTPRASRYTSEGKLNQEDPRPTDIHVREATLWCRGSIGILKDAHETALTAKLQGRMADARETYVAGIEEAIEKAEKLGELESLVLQSMKRTLKIADALQSALYDQDDRDQRLVEFFEKSHKFMVNVAETVDLPVFIPYVYGGGKFDLARHERKFADYGRVQIQWILDNFVTETTTQFTARYNDKVYLTLAEHISGEVAKDLAHSLFAQAYACQVQDLDRLSSKLAKHNAGDMNVYGGRPAYAVNSSAKVFKEVIEQLKTGCPRSAY